MCMDEFVKRLYDFMGIYRIFWSQNSHYRYLPIFYRYLLIFFQKFQHKRVCSIVAIFRWKNRRFYRVFPDFSSDRFFLCFFFSVPVENQFFGDIGRKKRFFVPWTDMALLPISVSDNKYNTYFL